MRKTLTFILFGFVCLLAAEWNSAEAGPFYATTTGALWEGLSESDFDDDVSPVFSDTFLLHPDGVFFGRAHAFSNPNLLGLFLEATGENGLFQADATSLFSDTLHFFEADGITPISEGTIAATLDVNGVSKGAVLNRIDIEGTLRPDGSDVGAVQLAQFRELQTADPEDPFDYAESFVFAPVSFTTGFVDLDYGIIGAISSPGSLDFSHTATISSIAFFRPGETTADTSVIIVGDSGVQYQNQTSAVPEPSSMALLGIGVMSLFGCGLRRNRCRHLGNDGARSS